MPRGGIPECQPSGRPETKELNIRKNQTTGFSRRSVVISSLDLRHSVVVRYRTRIAMAANSPTPSTAAEIVAAIARKQASALSVVQAAIERAERLTDLNSLISLHKDAAVTAAQKIDAARDAGAKLPAVAGLPIVVKDNINTSDMPTSAGTAALQNARPKKNAPVAAETARCRRDRHRQG